MAHRLITQVLLVSGVVHSRSSTKRNSASYIPHLDQIFGDTTLRGIHHKEYPRHIGELGQAPHPHQHPHPHRPTSSGAHHSHHHQSMPTIINLHQPSQNQQYPQPSQNQQYPQPPQNQQYPQPSQNQQYPQPPQNQKYSQSYPHIIRVDENTDQLFAEEYAPGSYHIQTVRDISDHSQIDHHHDLSGIGEPHQPAALPINNELETVDQAQPEFPDDVPEGFDLNTVEPGPDGTFCVYKTVTIEGLEKMPVQECIHRVDRQCYDSFVTQFTPTTEEFCSENYKKKCFVDFNKQSVQEVVEKCYSSQERVCEETPIEETPNEICQTQYETACITNFRDTPVVENVEECNKVYRKKCENVTDSSYASTVTKVCHNEPVKACGQVPKTVIKKLPFTKCERLPFEACAPDNCRFVPGEIQCHNKTVDIGIDVPEEVCDMQPQKKCEQVYRLVPKLQAQEICEDVPREICFTTLKNPQPVQTPLLTKWCFTPEDDEEDEDELTYEPIEQQYPPPPPKYHHPYPPPSYPAPSYPAPAYPAPHNEEETTAYPPTHYEAQAAEYPEPKPYPVYPPQPPKQYGYKIVEPQQNDQTTTSYPKPPQTKSPYYPYTTPAPYTLYMTAQTTASPYEPYTDVPDYGAIEPAQAYDITLNNDLENLEEAGRSSFSPIFRDQLDLQRKAAQI